MQKNVVVHNKIMSLYKTYSHIIEESPYAMKVACTVRTGRNPNGQTRNGEPAISTGENPFLVTSDDENITFAFGQFISATGTLTEIQLDIYIYTDDITDRDYANHIALNIPTDEEAINQGLQELKNKYGNGSEYSGLVNALKAGNYDNGTWSITIESSVFQNANSIEFLVQVHDNQGAQWGNNNYTQYPNDVQAFTHNFQ